MFSRNAGVDLWASPWVTNDTGEIQEDGLAEAVRLCRRILDIPHAVFEEAVRFPPNVDLEFTWDLRAEIALIKPRATEFIPSSARVIGRALASSPLTAFEEVVEPLQAWKDP